MLTDIVGTSVLTYAGVARQLGWVFTIAFIVLLCPVAIYVALLMSRTRQMLSKSLGKEPVTMGEAGRLTLGGDKAAAVVYALVYGFAFLGQASYLLVLGQTLQGVFYEMELCLPMAIVAGGIAVLPLAVVLRRLSESVWLCLLNLFLILAVLAIVMARLAARGRPEDTRTFFFAEDVTVFSIFGAMTNIIFSYTGHWLYFELMAEMQTPEHFPRVFTINAPLQVGLYLLVACWGYYFAGDKANGYFLDNLPSGPAYRWASVLLFVHVGIAFLLKNVALARFLHGLLAPSRVDVQLSEPGGVRAHAEYAGCAVLLLVLGAGVAKAVPYFMDFMGLVGGLLGGPISFLLPMAFYVGARRRAKRACALGAAGCGSARTLSTDTSPDCIEAAAAKLNYTRTPPQGGDTVAARLSRPLREASAEPGSPVDGQRELPFSVKWTWQDMVLFLAIGLLTVMTMVVGTYSVASSFASHMGADGSPFSCKVSPRHG